MADEKDWLIAVIDNEGLAYTVLHKVKAVCFAVIDAEQEAKEFKAAYDALVKKVEAAGIDV